MLYISRAIQIDERELHEDFIRSPGPGGQNVNKVATGVQLRFSIDASRSLPEEIKVRLRRIAGKRVNDEGVLILSAHRYRSQERNRQDARLRLADLIRKAMEKPRRRIATRPSKAARQRRLDSKKKHSEKKQRRQQNF